MTSNIAFLINSTLKQEYPELAEKEPCSCNGNKANNSNKTDNDASNATKKPKHLQESASKLQEIFPPSVSITPVIKRKGTTEEKTEAKRVKNNNNEENGITILEQTSITIKECDPSWSLGCLYR